MPNRRHRPAPRIRRAACARSRHRRPLRQPDGRRLSPASRLRPVHRTGGRAARATLTLLHETAVAMHAFAMAVAACEDAGLTREHLAWHLESVRAIHAASPFVHRLQAWPRGYAGDFETVEWLCDARNRAPLGTVPWAIEQCALQSPLAQQHRNKVGLQARAILSTLAANPAARIASIGCGGCRDLSLIQDYVPAVARHVRADRRGRGRAGLRARAARSPRRPLPVRPGPRAARPRQGAGRRRVPSGGRRRPVRLPAGSVGGGDAERRARAAPAGRADALLEHRDRQPVPPVDRVPGRLAADRARRGGRAAAARRGRVRGRTGQGHRATAAASR